MEIKMRKNFMTLLLVLSLVLCSCGRAGQEDLSAVNSKETQAISNREENPEQSRQNGKSEEDAPNAYLSITETRWNNGTDSTEGMTILEFLYDLDSGELEEIGGVAYTSQYPLAVYSKGDDVIYFSADEETGNNRDQVYCLDRKTGDVYRLTEGLFAINYIIPTQDQVIIVAAGTTETILRPYIYEKSTGEVHKVEVYEDFDVKYCSYNPITERLFLGGFLASERYAANEEFCDYVNKNGLDYFTTPATPMDGYIFELVDGYGTPKQVLRLEEQGVEKGLPSDEDGNLYLQLSFRAPLALFEPVTESKVFNTATGELTDSDYFDELPLTISSYTKYGEDYYILGMGNAGSYPRGIYRYHPGEKPELIYQAAADGFINQFALCLDCGKTSLALEKAEKVHLKAANATDTEENFGKEPAEVSVPTIPEEKQSAGEQEKIPKRMQPYTIIEYVSEDEYVVLQGGEPAAGLYNENGLTEEEQRIQDEIDAMIREEYSDNPVYHEENENPSPVAGMKVYYDTLGFIYSIVEPGKE